MARRGIDGQREELIEAQKEVQRRDRLNGGGGDGETMIQVCQIRSAPKEEAVGWRVRWSLRRLLND